MDACVIAINDSQFNGFWRDAEGASRKPWAVEAVLPVGLPVAVFTRGSDEAYLKNTTRRQVNR